MVLIDEQTVGRSEDADAGGTVTIEAEVVERAVSEVVRT